MNLVNRSFQPVVVLFVRPDSLYKTMQGVECYDAQRDALTWAGGCPVVAHPPCRSWGMLAHMAKPRQGEKELAPWAIEQVRKWGGVLEHPAGSRLFRHCGCAVPDGLPDEWGGRSLLIDQYDFGHVAHKATILYIVGCAALPPLPPKNTAPTTKSIAGESPNGGVKGTHRCTQKEREETPLKLAEWMIEVARRSHKHNEIAKKTERNRSAQIRFFLRDAVIRRNTEKAEV